MDEPNEKPRRYKWPRFLLAAILLFLVLAVLWVSYEVRTVEQERNPNAPRTTSATP